MAYFYGSVNNHHVIRNGLIYISSFEDLKIFQVILPLFYFLAVVVDEYLDIRHMQILITKDLN